MRRMSFFVMAVAAVLAVNSLSAQSKPNFAGKWTMVADPAAAPPAAPGGGAGGPGGGRGMGRGGGGFCGNECTIAQDGTTLTVTRTTQAGDRVAAYKLDGSDSKNSQPGRQGGEPVEVVSKASWSGNNIVISTTRDMGGQSMTTKTTVSMSGSEMVIENTSDFGQGPNTTKMTYKKS